MDWAARPISIDAKPAATNKEDINPLVPGKAVKVVEPLIKVMVMPDMKIMRDLKAFINNNINL